MCGIVGIVARNEVKQDIYDALTILQHRGQDAAGMVTTDGRRCYLRKDNGLVKDVFQAQHMQRLKGNVGLGQCRYPTADPLAPPKLNHSTSTLLTVLPLRTTVT